ncbi:1,2-phenylacetyl-CoA epoxidase subunit PaaC [Spongiactinospora sp. TRM90649]|uniref:1,2-phenylacetyl-CoA epoxidase subunit PaaC n=1 Tax=Spongiactinospora sp. TRM90649 TaxID=3031114 RepID=UPI0023F8B431|nr:1,2-phenylacetyl-CoA epoxidase subunit PaaC [Spongiactinospora sp. TRM90649]MDF5753587.1 phenylacetate-CoA oxygenase subunit PaaC [Spongiactinospora sp. TRM90649]
MSPISEELAQYCLMLGDDALIMSHRLQEWCTHAPELEEEVALANIALDLLGQARLLLARAGGSEADEDRLAFFRDAGEFRNVRFVEKSGDFAVVMARLLVFSAWRLALFGALTASRDPELAAVAKKGVKELAYHRDHAAQWMVRLGDGTDLSRERAQRAWDDALDDAAELLHAHPVERRMAGAGIGADPAAARAALDEVLTTVATAATLRHRPLGPPPDGGTGRYGEHSAPMAGLLGELQGVARAHPDATW